MVLLEQNVLKLKKDYSDSIKYQPQKKEFSKTSIFYEIQHYKACL